MVFLNCGELFLLDNEAEMTEVSQKAMGPLIFPNDLSGEMYLEGALHFPRFAFKNTKSATAPPLLKPSVIFPLIIQ